jgi:ABC-type multidrug transport system fused ATPase/permease subunit
VSQPMLQPFFRLIRAYFVRRTDLILSGCLIVLIAATDLVNPLLVMEAIDRLADSRGLQVPSEAAAVWSALLTIAGIMVALVVVQYFARYALGRIQNHIVYRGTARLRVDLYARLQAQSVNFYSERRIGEVLTHLVTDIQVFQDATLDLLCELPFDLCTLVGLLTAMFILNPLLALIVLAFLVAVIVISLAIGHRGWGSQETVLEQTGRLTAEFQELLSASRTLQVFNAEAGEQQRIAAATQEHAAGLEQAGKTRAAITPFFGLSEYIGLLLVLLVGGWLMLHGSLSAGGLVAFLAYMEIAAEPMTRGAELLPKLQKAAVAANRIHDVLGEARDTTPIPNVVAAAAVAIQGTVRVRDLEYRYPRGAQPALRKLSFAVKRGEKVAVVGPNGAGKSTLLDLLLRLQAPDGGVIEIDGVDLQTIGVSHWRASIGVVPQDVFLLNRTVAENIALGAAKDSAVRDAARNAGVEEAILALPKGYDTIVGDRGVCLSGGERQRVAIARLFLRDPKIILLDETTAALDARAEQELLPALRRLCEGRTTFVVSHRPALLEDAGKVLLLVRGEQVAFGTPAKVWEQCSHLRDFFPSTWNPDRTRRDYEPVSR